jgi:two-component system cell cycle response regulator DivK
MEDDSLANNILIIEDNAVNRKLVEVILTKSGYTVLSAADAEQGISLARSGHPDLILMDIHLPGMDGLSATRLLKSEDSTKDIPIIALTAMAMKGDEKRTLEAGCDGYIDKPIRHHSLIDAVIRLLKPKGQSDE